MNTQHNLLGRTPCIVPPGLLAKNAPEGGDGFAELKTALTGYADQTTTAVKTLTDRLDKLETRMNRPGTLSGNSAGMLANATAERKAVGTFVRTGDDRELKSYQIAVDPDGGYLVAPALSDAINRKVFDVSPIGRLARRVQITTGDAFEEPIDASDIGATWVGESEARPATTTGSLKYLRVPVEEIYALQPVTQRLLDDSRFDVGAWIEGKIANKFARSEGAAFVNGDGLKKPQGLLTFSISTAADSTRDWFTVQYVPTGVSGAFAASNPADMLIDLVYSLRAPYRPNARWLMNRKTAGVIRKIKNSSGDYIWSELANGQPATLLGFPVELDEEFPDISANSLSIAFGDIQSAYLVIEKPGVRLLRDPFSSKPNCLVYGYRRVGGGLQNGEAVKLLRFSVS
jgi:HK97 family phage major capsid protein